jgi:hypothetical protein
VGTLNSWNPLGHSRPVKGLHLVVVVVVVVVVSGAAVAKSVDVEGL